MQSRVDTRELHIPWFDINTIDSDNFRFHLEQTPAQEAWLAERIAEADRNYRNANDQCDQARSQAFMEAKSKPFERMTSKGLLKVDASDEVAKHFANLDPTYQQLQRVVNDLRAERDKWFGYQRAMQTKKAFLASLAGLTRAEIENQLGG